MVALNDFGNGLPFVVGSWRRVKPLGLSDDIIVETFDVCNHEVLFHVVGIHSNSLEVPSVFFNCSRLLGELL